MKPWLVRQKTVRLWNPGPDKQHNNSLLMEEAFTVWPAKECSHLNEYNSANIPEDHKILLTFWVHTNDRLQSMPCRFPMNFIIPNKIKTVLVIFNKVTALFCWSNCNRYRKTLSLYDRLGQWIYAAKYNESYFPSKNTLSISHQFGLWTHAHSNNFSYKWPTICMI